MKEDLRPPDPERTLRNLRAVARRLASGEAAPSRSDAPVSPSAAPRPSAARWKKLAAWGPLGVVLVFVLGKAKILLPLLKFAKLGTLASMVLSVWLYAQLWGLAFAAGFVVLVLVHEMGHALVMRRLGIRAGAPVFIPFVGAFIAMKGTPRSAHAESLVALGGPVVGSLGALACLLVGRLTGASFWYALASSAFLINLFNLIPVSPLDGGRIVGGITRWLWLAGYGVGVAAFFVTRSPLLFLILLLGLFGLGRSLRGPRAGYFEIEPRRRLALGAAYFGLIALLALGMWAADGVLEPLRESVSAGRS